MTLIKVWRLATLMLCSLSMAMAFSHLLQMQPRMSYDAALWRETQNMYRLYGPPIGALIEGGAWLSVIALAYLVRRRGQAFRWTLWAAGFFVAALVIFWAFVFPVNVEMAQWTPAAMPSDWADYRKQWETSHAVRALVQIAGLAALFMSVLIETPEEPGTA